MPNSNQSKKPSQARFTKAQVLDVLYEQRYTVARWANDFGFKSVTVLRVLNLFIGTERLAVGKKDRAILAAIIRFMRKNRG